MPVTNEEAQFINKLKVSSPSITEQEIRGQNNNPLWFQIRRYRLTSSNFGLVCKRNLNLSQTKFVQNTILPQKDLFNVSAVKYGTVEPRFNEVLDITNDTLCPDLNYSKMYGIEPRYNEP